MPENTQAYRERLMKEGRHAELYQALIELLQAAPNNPGLLYDTGLSAFFSGKYQEAARYWGQLKALEPQDFQVRAKLVQVYEILQERTARERERAELLELYNQRKGGENVPAYYCRDQFGIPNLRVMVYENFELSGDMAVRYTFHIFKSNQQIPEFTISLGSYALTNQYMHERGTLKPGERIFHLDEYRPGGSHRSLKFYNNEPPYDVVKNDVLAVLPPH